MSFDLWGGGAIVAAVALGFLAEQRWPLRRRVRPLGERLVTNAAMVALAAMALPPGHDPRRARRGRGRRAGRRGRAPLAAAPGRRRRRPRFLLLDWTVYVWHRLNHRAPLLWRFHVVHHTDLDLDVSTAFRFHAGELLLSVLWRSAQIVVLASARGWCWCTRRRWKRPPRFITATGGCRARSTAR